ncbi:MAG: hypothetical protein IJL37_09010 [Bacteroidaceae bacterium]|nr:hypothetical protein [Bacteroidaceae bacterium]
MINNAMRKKRIFYFIIVLFAAIISYSFVTSCANQKQGSNEQASVPESYESNTLMSWTDEALLKDNQDLVRVANELWSFVYGGENLHHSFDDLLAWGDRCDELLVKYYEANFEKKDISNEIKRDSVINRVSTFYEPMSNGSTMDMMIASDVERGIMQYKVVRKYNELLSADENSQRKTLIRNEMERWKEFSDSLYRVGADIISLESFGGTIGGLLVNSFARGFDDVRLEKDMLQQLALFNGSSNFPEQNQNAQSLIKTYSDALNEAYSKDIAEEYEEYETLHQKASDLIPKVEDLYNKWIASRAEIAQALDSEKAKIYNVITENIIDGLCCLILEKE